MARDDRQGISNRVRELRATRGLSQQALAERAGLTRQTVSAIEHHRYVPGTAVALKLAGSLGCRVEDLFSLRESAGERQVEMAGRPSSECRRLALAQVRGRLVAHPLVAGAGVQEGFVSADAMLPQNRDARRARLLVDPVDLERTALLMGCDPSLGILCTHLARHSPEARLVWMSSSSRRALEALAGGEAHLAGSHLLNFQSGKYNVTQARDALGTLGGLVIAFARWEQGFVVAPGNPLSLRGVEDLVRPDVRIVNREPGSGCRDFLDMLLAQTGITPQAVRGFDVVAGSHWAVARSVASGGADVGISLRAVSQACGLDFVPLSEVQFDLVVPRDLVEHPALAAMLDVLQTKSFRDELRALPGYEVATTGEVVAEVPGAA